MRKQTYVATIIYHGGACDVKIVKANDLKDAWQKVVKKELAGRSISGPSSSPSWWMTPICGDAHECGANAGAVFRR